MRLCGEVFDFEEIAFLNGAQDRSSMIEAMVVLKMIVVVELGSPRICWIGPANGVGVIPISLCNMVSDASAVDDRQMTSCWIVDVDFCPAAESGDGADGGKKLAELFVGYRLDGCCGLPDGIRGERSPELGWVGSRA